MFLQMDNNTEQLIRDAAKRSGVSVDELIGKLVDDAANEEYAKQQCEDAKTC